MKYLWTEDRGAGLHFWELANQYLFQNRLVVESKISNQGLLDAVRALRPEPGDIYYIAFDIVFDNMDIVNKFLELHNAVQKFPGQIILLDITCFEGVILSFSRLVEWTGTGRKDKIEIRRHILDAIKDHRIDLDSIEDEKTLDYVKGFKRFSTERIIKSLAYELTDGDAWSVKGDRMGACWHKDCCVLDAPERAHCGIDTLSGREKMLALLLDDGSKHIIKDIKG